MRRVTESDWDLFWRVAWSGDKPAIVEVFVLDEFLKLELSYPLETEDQRSNERKV